MERQILSKSLLLHTSPLSHRSHTCPAQASNIFLSLPTSSCSTTIALLEHYRTISLNRQRHGTTLSGLLWISPSILSKQTSAVLFLRMKPCCCSRITSLFNLTSETFSHSYITFLISFIRLYLLQICT